MIAGVDGCRNGWLAAIETKDGEILVSVFNTFKSLIDKADISLIVIDIPIGLTKEGHRACDDKAREFVGERRSSVFPAPLRPMLRATNYEEACGIRREIEGKKCSKQLWAITSKINQVDECMNSELQKRVSEGHPEVSFACMNGDCSLSHSKHAEEGLEQRIKLLERHFPNIRIRLTNLAPLKADGDDMIDALACLWTARRVSSGEAKRFPSQPPIDERGLRMEING